jgi:hypothetical protein
MIGEVVALAIKPEETLSYGSAHQISADSSKERFIRSVRERCIRSTGNSTINVLP